MSALPPSNSETLFPALSQPDRDTYSNTPSRFCPATFTVAVVQQIEMQLSQMPFYCDHFNLSCANIRVLLQYLSSFPSETSEMGELSSTQLSSHLIDITETALMTFLFYFHPRDRRAWGAALEHSFSTLLELLSELDQHVKMQGDFVLQLRMATLSGMLYQDQASSVSPCATAQSPGRNYALPPVVTPSGPLRSSTSSHSLVLASPFALTSLCHSTRPTQSQLENSAAGSDPEIIACLSSPFIPSDANSHSLCDSAEFAEILSIESALADDARACLDIVLDLPDGTSPGVDWSFLLDNDLDKISDALTHVTVSSPNTVPDEALPLAPTSSRSSLGSYNHSTPSLATTPVEIPHLGPIYPNYGYGYPKDSVPTSPPKPLTHIGISSFSSPLSPSSSIPSSPIQQRQFRNILPLPLPLQGTETTNFVPVKRKLENDGSIIIREPVKNKQKKEGGLPVEPCTGAEGARNHLPDSVVEGKENIQKERK